MKAMGSSERNVEFLSFNGIRIRLNFAEGIDRENAWFYIEFTNINCIRRLRKKICHRFGLVRQNIKLYLDEYLLCPDETISVLQENDCISVRLKAAEEEKNEQPDTNAVLKSKRRRKSEEKVDTNKETFENVITAEPLKKRRRCRPTTTKKDISPAKKNVKRCNFSKVIGVKTPGQNHIRFDDDEDVKDDDEDENNEEVNEDDEDENNQEVIEDTEMNTTKQENDEKMNKCYENLPPLQGPPRIGDILAFKELVLSESYTPEISEFQEGKVTGVNGNSITLFIKNRTSIPQRLNGKFELNWDEVEGVEPQTEYSAELTLPFNSLLQPRLVTIDY